MNKQGRQWCWRCRLCVVIACFSVVTTSRAATAHHDHGTPPPAAAFAGSLWRGAAAFLAASSEATSRGGWDPVTTLGVVAQGDPVTIEKGKRDFLEPNRPNPFGATWAFTKIGYSIGEDSHVRLTIYDFFYSKVLTLVDAEQKAGSYVISFNPPATLPTGMYFYELVTPRTRELRRMLYVK